MPDINSFSSPPARDGVPVTSTIDKTNLVARIQADYTDPYFDENVELGKVYITYRHEEGRQEKTILHLGAGLTGSATWSVLAKSGVWQKIRVRVIDNDGATHNLNRTAIGTGEDLTLT